MRRAAAVMFAGGCAMACHPQPQPQMKSSPTTQPAYIGMAGQAPVVAPTNTSPVQEGEPPLAYRVESNVTIRVMDETANAVVATSPLKAGDFVAVTNENGIVMGGERLLKGPLPEGHRYGIYVDQPSRNLYRSGVIVPEGNR